MSIARYRATQARAEAPRQTEVRAFAHVNALLANATSAPARIAALHTNHKLWSILLSDLAAPGNALPPALKGQLASLAIWAQRESLRLMDADAPLEALMALNRDMAEGLAAQRGPAPPAATPAPAQAPAAIPAGFAPAVA